MILSTQLKKYEVDMGSIQIKKKKVKENLDMSGDISYDYNISAYI